MNVERMNSILFDDSTIVRSSQAVQQLTTTIPASQTMTVRVKCTIIKLIRRRESSSNMEETIPGTFEFINGHGGFLNEDFRLFSTDNKNGKLTYQRFLNGYQPSILRI